MKEPVDYMQTDSRWAGTKYAAKGENTTIKSSGCGTTCAAMVIAGLKDKTVNPVTTANWSMRHGYKAYHQGTYYSYFVPQFKAYGIECKQLNSFSIYHGSNSARSINSLATNAVKNGKWVICCMGKGDWTRSGHFILWYKNDGNNAVIFDPNSKRKSRRYAPIPKLQYQVKYYWVIDTEEDEMTQAEFNKMMDNYLTQLSITTPGDWSKTARDWGYNNDVMTDGAYKRFLTREEAISMLYRYDKTKK